jgi:hypothetical protein
MISHPRSIDSHVARPIGDLRTADPHRNHRIWRLRRADSRLSDAI